MKKITSTTLMPDDLDVKYIYVDQVSKNHFIYFGSAYINSKYENTIGRWIVTKKKLKPC